MGVDERALDDNEHEHGPLDGREEDVDPIRASTSLFGASVVCDSPGACGDDQDEQDDEQGGQPGRNAGRLGLLGTCGGVWSVS